MIKLEELTDLLRVLQDPTRLRLLWVLRRGELSVGEVVQITGLSQPRVSRHLKLLCDARVVRRTPDQNEVYYRAAIDDDRRDLVAAVLSNLSERDPVIVRGSAAADCDPRQPGGSRAGIAGLHLGVRPPRAPGTCRRSVRSIDALLARRLSRGREWQTAWAICWMSVPAPEACCVSWQVGPGARWQWIKSRDMRLIARAAVLSAGLANCTVRRKATCTPWNSRTIAFDLVTMDRVLGAAKDPTAALREAARVMKDDAHLLVVETLLATTGEQRSQPGYSVGRMQRDYCHGVLERHLVRAGLSPVDLQAAAQDSVLIVLAARRCGIRVRRWTTRRREISGDR